MNNLDALINHRGVLFGANSKKLVNLKTDREIILDSCNSFREYGAKSIYSINNKITLIREGGIYKLKNKKEEIYLENNKCRYSSLIGCRGSTILLVEEIKKNTYNEDYIGIIGNKKQIKKLVSGEDFYQNIQIHNNNLIYISWNKKHMPWENGKLFMTKIKNNKLIKTVFISGGYKKSVISAKIIGSNIYYIQEKNNISNLYRYNLTSKTKQQITKNSIDYTTPMWQSTISTMCVNNKYILLHGLENGRRSIHMVDRKCNHKVMKLKHDFINDGIFDVIDIVAFNNYFALILSNPANENSVFITQETKIKPLRNRKFKKNNTKIIEIPCQRKANFNLLEKNEYSLYGLLHQSEGSDKAILHMHGGPTGSFDRGYNKNALFFNKNGFNYIEIDYHGSIGHGKNFRRAIYKNWGKIEVNDIINSYNYIKKNIAKHVFITGNSAGGYSVLNIFSKKNSFIGASVRYPVFDLDLLKKNKFKFESGYLDSLNAKLQPIINYDSKKILWFHGDKDNVVPIKNVKIANANDIKIIKNEGHSFSKKTKEYCLEKQLDFFRELLKCNRKLTATNNRRHSI